MKLKHEWPLMMPAGESPSQGTPSQTPSGNEGGGPQDNTATIDDLNQNRTDGAHEDDDEQDSSDLDWTKASEPTLDSDDEGSQPAQPQQPSQTPSPAPQQQPQQQPQPGTTQQPQQAEPSQPQGQPPAQQPPQQEQQQQQQQQPPAETDQQREERLTRERQQRETQLQEFYKLPDDLAAKLATEPETVMPVLASKVHMAVERGIQTYLHEILPQMFQQFQAVTQQENKVKESFYTRWPSLSKHEGKVLEVGRMFRQMNPKATPEESLETIGAIACAALGITPDPRPGAGGNGQHRPAPQQTRQQQRPMAPRPAATSSSNAGATPPPDNPFTVMANEFLEDDEAG